MTDQPIDKLYERALLSLAEAFWRHEAEGMPALKAARDQHSFTDQSETTQAKWLGYARVALTRPVPLYGMRAEELVLDEKDDRTFDDGVQHTVELLAKWLGVTDWVGADGSEDHDTDLGATLLNILAAKGLYDKDERRFAALRSPAPAVGVTGTARDAIIALVEKSMRDTWNDFCSDTGCHPDDIEHGRGKILSFEPKHWARFTGEAVADALSVSDAGAYHSANVGPQPDEPLCDGFEKSDAGAGEPVVKRDWVQCPVCGESDMRQETDAEGHSLIFCVNHGCLSNNPKAKPPTLPPVRDREAVAPVQRIECVKMVDCLEVEAEPLWRIEIDGYCADFETETGANNFRNAILSLRLQPSAGEREALHRSFADAVCTIEGVANALKRNPKIDPDQVRHDLLLNVRIYREAATANGIDIRKIKPDDEPYDFNIGDQDGHAALDRHLAEQAAALSPVPDATVSAARETEAAGAIIDAMMGGKFDWRSRIDQSDFLESADWQQALLYARAALRSSPQDAGRAAAIAGPTNHQILGDVSPPAAQLSLLQ